MLIIRFGVSGDGMFFRNFRKLKQDVVADTLVSQQNYSEMERTTRKMSDQVFLSAAELFPDHASGNPRILSWKNCLQPPAPTRWAVQQLLRGSAILTVRYHKRHLAHEPRGYKVLPWPDRKIKQKIGIQGCVPNHHHHFQRIFASPWYAILFVYSYCSVRLVSGLPRIFV